MYLNGKVVVATGASGGIGEAVVRDLASAGAKLVITARSADKLARLAAELGDAAYLAGEVTDETLPRRLLDLAIERFGRADILFNNAGVMHVGSIEDTDIDKACAMVRINVEAVFRTALTFLKHFKRQGSGYLINTSSIAGVMIRQNIGAYAGTKHAVEAFTESLQMELAGTDIGVAAIEPGTVATGLYRDWDKSSQDWVNSEGVLAPEDIARAVRFILEQPTHVRIPRMLVLPAGAHAERPTIAAAG